MADDSRGWWVGTALLWLGGIVILVGLLFGLLGGFGQAHWDGGTESQRRYLGHQAMALPTVFAGIGFIVLGGIVSWRCCGWDCEWDDESEGATVPPTPPR